MLNSLNLCCRSLRHCYLNSTVKMASTVTSAAVLNYQGLKYKNVLNDLKASSDIRYAFMARQFPVYKFTKVRQPKQIVDDTINSHAVQEAIEVAMKEKHWSRLRAEEEARKILLEMAQTFDMKAVRALAYPAKKIIQRLYTGIYVNDDAIPRIRASVVDNPVLLMPSHRTYMDFILIQFLCYHYELPLPAIASAVDFLQMRVMSQMLRRCGAYFIRRSFNDNPFYRAIFSEYVRTQLSNGDRTMEAFVEGTRSRTGKSLHPKYGFLSTVIEPFLRSDVYDIAIVPVSINYSKIIEETLYAYEMLGFSKPRESTSALLKARKILGSNYGEVHVTFGQPISIRDFFAQFPTPIDRGVHNLPPSGVFQMNENEKKAVHCLAHRIVKIQENNAVVGVWPLACFFVNKFLAYSSKVSTDQAIYFDDICRKVAHAYDLAGRLGRPIYRYRNTLAEDLSEQFELHKNFVDFDTATQILRLKPVQSTDVDLSRCSNEEMFKWVDSAVPRLILANYANQCYHLFADVFYLAAHFGESNMERPIESLRRDVAFLQRLFDREFIVDTLTQDHSFNRALEMCQSAQILMLSSGFVCVKNTQDIKFLKSLLEPYLINYYICIDYLLAKQTNFPENEYVRDVQQGILMKFDEKYAENEQKEQGNVRVENFNISPRWFQVLSIDTIKNCLHNLNHMGAVQKMRGMSSNCPVYSPNLAHLTKIKERLGVYFANFYEIEKEEIKIKAKL